MRTNQKAIRQRGWYPANYRQLTYPDIIKTRPVTALSESSGTAAVQSETQTPSDVSTRTGYLSSSQSTIATQVYPSP